MALSQDTSANWFAVAPDVPYIIQTIFEPSVWCLVVSCGTVTSAKASLVDCNLLKQRRSTSSSLCHRPSRPPDTLSVGMTTTACVSLVLKLLGLSIVSNSSDDLETVIQ